MKLTIAIVDDLAGDREALKQDILTFCQERNLSDATVEGYAGADEMLADFARGVFEVAFLDICMEPVSGIELAGRLRALDTALLIVFLTTSREYAFDAFPVHSFDYLLKPGGYDRLCGVMEEVLRTLSSPEPEITVKVPHGEMQIPLAKIISVRSDKHAVYLHTDGGRIIRSIMTFAQMTELLANTPCFLLCNRGILINMDHALAIEGNVIRMDNGAVYPLRVRNQADLYTHFSQYQISRMKRRTGK